MPLLALLLKRIGRYGKTPSQRFHCPEMILESEGGSGRVVGHSEVIVGPYYLFLRYLAVATAGSMVGNVLEVKKSVSSERLVGCCERLPLAFLVAAPVPAQHHPCRCHPERSERSRRRYPR